MEWREIAPELDRALDMEPAERAEWLAQLATTNPPLAQTLRSMLERHGRLEAQGFLAHSPVAAAVTEGRAGTRVGAYLIERLLGRGGMGEVWLATRSDGRFEGKCALKFLDVSVASARIVDRFRREGTFLARLTHPNIARLLDAGAAGDQPYLALEYIDGERIDRHCSLRALTIEQRVRLFVEVVAAVAHAHSHLIIHRDLKPSNVLVTRDGQVKLLDFGIAKLLVSDPADGADATRLEDAALTPEYAAPEQLLGETPSTATDVYQLGLLLYVLLTGKHPVAVAGTRAEKIRAALESVVPRASDVAEPADRGNLRGDLDAILDMALRRNATERYATAQALKEDLQRFLNREPVAARRGAALYRARKFVQRHRIATLGTVAAASGLVLALLFALGQAREAQRQRDTTRKELARATAVNDFATYLVSAAGAGDGRFTAAELLAASEDLIDKQFPADGPVKAEILAMVGAQYLIAQRFDKAGPVLDRAAVIAATIGDPALSARVNCPRALVKAMRGNLKEESIELIERTLAELPDAAEYAQLRAECLTRYSEFGQNNGLPEPAIRNAKAALALYDAQPGASVPRRIDAQAALAWGYYLAHDNEKADREFAAVAQALEAVGRGRTLAAADVYGNWSLVHYRGDVRRSEPLTARALELRRYIEGADGVDPNVTFNRAGVLLLLGRFEEASTLYEETMRTAEVRKRPSMLAYAAMEYADLKIQSGDLPAADALIARANAIMSAPQITRTNKAIMSYHLGMLAEAHGHLEKARSHYLDTVPAFERMQEKIALMVYLYCGISRVERALGHQAASAKAADDALAVARLMAEPNAPSHVLGRALLVLGQSQRAAGKVEESRQSFRLSRENLESTLGPGHVLSREAANLSDLSRP
jgi:eukaryotic-like serine/threonine-protein kinase